MRLEIATMALGLAVFTRSFHIRSVSAFQIVSSTQTRSFATTIRSSSSSAGVGVGVGRNGNPLHASVEAVSGADSDTLNIDDLFPQKGKDLEDCAPRMRFAPSPTGR